MPGPEMNPVPTSIRAPFTGARFISLPASPWLATFPIALITAIPVVVLLGHLLHPDQAIWHHLWQFVLPELLANTAWLVLGVGLGVSLLGVSLAWLTAACDYPGRRFFAWALLLPLALPAYVTAFVWLGLLDFTGPLATWLRETWGIHWLPPIRSRGGVILVMVLALYPYVYLTARAAFQGMGPRLTEAAQSLGVPRWRAFFRVALPMARPGITAGLMLALMETLADFGTVSVFNYNTFTTAIYKAWFSMFSLPAAAQLAAILIFFVFVVAVLENLARSRRSYALSTRSSQMPARIALKSWGAWGAFAWSAAVFGLAFLVPVVQIADWAAGVYQQDFDARYLGFAWRSLLLSGLGALLVAGLALVLAYAQRLRPTPAMQFTARIASLGYALPGTVLAVGIFIPVAWLDNQLIDLFGLERQVLAGTLLIMLLAYCARFLAVGFGPVESGLSRITRSVDEAAQSLGVVGVRRLARIHLPMLRASLLTALALAFVDIMKELPITLMTRPFGWDTLAVRVFEMTSEGEWERAALPAAVIVLVGLLPTYWLIKHTEHAHT